MDDVVLQRPEDQRFLVPVFHTPTACCGAVTAYLLRRIAYRAGAYAPGIQEHIFHELNTAGEGGSIEKVQRWFNVRVSSLHELGYRLQCRRVATPTNAVLEWVRAGRGYRGAMLPTSWRKLYPPTEVKPAKAGDAPAPVVNGAKEKVEEAAFHAVGITVDRLEATGDEALVQIDPWPGTVPGVDKGPISKVIESAHRERGSHSLVFFWVGWS